MLVNKISKFDLKTNSQDDRRVIGMLFSLILLTAIKEDDWMILPRFHDVLYFHPFLLYYHTITINMIIYVNNMSS